MGVHTVKDFPKSKFLFFQKPNTPKVSPFPLSREHNLFAQIHHYCTSMATHDRLRPCHHCRRCRWSSSSSTLHQLPPSTSSQTITTPVAGVAPARATAGERRCRRSHSSPECPSMLPNQPLLLHLFSNWKPPRQDNVRPFLHLRNEASLSYAFLFLS